MKGRNFILNLSGTDQPGIVLTVASQIVEAQGNITESHQYRDRDTNMFFMRTAFETTGNREAAELEARFSQAFERFGLDFSIGSADIRPRILIMVSKFDHAMLHLLYQIRVGWMDAEVAALVSNHEDSRQYAENESIPFHYLPVTPETKAAQEARLLELVDETGVELVVLARYMQVLSDDLCRKLSGRAINIHHSFLPAFKGANPYRRAHERGVKLIGATAHYVTADLDEGPIIEQDVQRVSHARSANEFIAEGREVESRVLAYAVKMHLERRVMVNGTKTVVFA